MRAAVYEGEGRLVIKDIPEPVPGPDEVLIEVEACGVCGSDVQMISVPPGHPSTPPVIVGHEFVGWVRGAGAAVRDVVIGQRVVCDPDPKCGACDPCRAGRPANCTNIVALGVYRDGAIAKYVTAPASAIFPIAESVPAEIAALVEPLACVANGTNRAALRPGESVVVFGAGAIGCLFISVFRASGAAKIIAIEPSTQRAPVAKSMGADYVLTPDEWAVQRADILPGGADVVVDAVGSVLPQCIDAAAMGARVIMFGMNGNARPPVHQVEIVEKGLTIVGSYITNFTFPAAIRMVESGALTLAPMITAIIGIDDTEAGIARIRSGEAVKIVIKP